jgi:nucleotide-binding universal stress UspA family protein
MVVGVDGSEGSNRALRWAFEHAGAGDVVDAVLAYDVPLRWIDVGSEYHAAIVEEATRGARKALDAALADVAPPPVGVTVHPVVVEGVTADVLVTTARDADLLVVGSRGRGGFAGLLLGSVSQRCAERAECPVVVVPAAPR